jgi:hypothetical protein
MPGQPADSNPAPSAASLLELQRRVRELEEQLEAAEESLVQKDQELEAMQVQLQQSHKQAPTAPVPAVSAQSVSPSRHVNEMQRLAAMMAPEQRDVPSAVAPSKRSLQVSPLLHDTAPCSISQPLSVRWDLNMHVAASDRCWLAVWSRSSCSETALPCNQTTHELYPDGQALTQQLATCSAVSSLRSC